MNQIQTDLFQASPALPEGFRYQPDFLSAHEERDLVERLATLPFKEFEFRGYRGNRRVLSFGWQYDFNRMELRKTEDIPDFLLPLRERAARVANLEASDLQHVLLTEYAPGAGLGGTRTSPCSPRWSASRLNRRACSASGARQVPSGSALPPWPSRARRICCRGPPGRIGSTASRLWTACATRSPSETSNLHTSLNGKYGAADPAACWMARVRQA